MTLDESRIGIRSRFNRVRMYNSNKPNKFTVEFFSLCNSEHYFIAHIDVYQGKEPHEMYVDDRAKGLPTTMKTVMNAIFKRGLDTNPSGRRYLSCDNRYAFPQLGVVLDKYKIDLGGTCRLTRKGYPTDLMTLKKSDKRGSYKMAYDMHNHVLCSQWVDSKVVHAVTTLPCTGVGKVKRKQGSSVSEFGDRSSYYGTVICEKMEAFQSLICFQISHTKCGYEL